MTAGQVWGQIEQAYAPWLWLLTAAPVYDDLDLAEKVLGERRRVEPSDVFLAGIEEHVEPSRFEGWETELSESEARVVVRGIELVIEMRTSARGDRQ